MLTGVSYVSIDGVSVLFNEICDRQGDRICTCQETVNQRAVILSEPGYRHGSALWSFFYTRVFVMMVVINKRADIFTVISSGQEAIFTDLT